MKVTFTINRTAYYKLTKLFYVDSKYCGGYSILKLEGRLTIRFPSPSSFHSPSPKTGSGGITPGKNS